MTESIRKEEDHSYHGILAVRERLSSLKILIDSLEMNEHLRQTYVNVDIADQAITFLPDTVMGSKRLVGHLERNGLKFTPRKQYPGALTLRAETELNGWKIAITEYQAASCRIEEVEEIIEVPATPAREAVEAHTITQMKKVLVCSDEEGTETRKDVREKEEA